MNGNGGQLSGYRVVARTGTPDCPVTLYQRRSDYVITSCGDVLMASRETDSERALGYTAAGLLRGIWRPRILVGGLGLGFTLRALLDRLPRDAQVVVAELLPAVVTWNRRRLGHLSGYPLLDPRVRLYVGNVARLLNRRSFWDAILLDIDNGPEWMVWRGNQRLYHRRGLARLFKSLRPGGFLAMWSAVRSAPFEHRIASLGLRARRFINSPDQDGYGPLIYVVSSGRHRPSFKRATQAW
jgi:spermidine synthase